MSQQLQITGGAKVRDLNDVIIGTSGVLSSLAFNVANGVPKLDVNGKILVSQLPNSVMEYKGTWDASTNTPTLVNGTGNQGDVYLCNVAGTVNFGAGAIAFFVGDQVIYSGSIWQRASGATGTVTSVAVTETGDSLNITGSPITTSGTINIGFNGTNLQYINGAGNLTTFPILTGYVPYTGATTDLNLGANLLKFTTEASDNASIGTTVSGSSSYFDFNLSDDNNQEEWRFRFTPSGGSVYDAVRIRPVSATASDLLVSGSIGAANFSGSSGGTNTGDVTIGTANGLSLAGQVLSLAAASASVTGALTSSDWSSFNSKVSSQWTTSGSDIFYNTGNVSVNTTTSGTGRFFVAADTDSGITIRNTGTADRFQLFVGSTGGATYTADNAIIKGTNTAIDFYNGSTATKKVTIPNSGNYLEVYGDAYVQSYVKIGNGSGNYTALTTIASGTKIVTFPNATGTVALTSDIPSTTGFVPYTGATTNLDMGANGLYANNLTITKISTSATIDFPNTGTMNDPAFIKHTESPDNTAVMSFSVGDNDATNDYFVFGNTSSGFVERFKITATGVVTIGTWNGTAIGDTYISSAATWNAKVSSVSATSPVLSSGGTTPTISIPAATTSVSGYLTSTDWTTFNNKGTFTLPSLTSGSVLFSNGSTIAQDNANFFWDDTNNRLGIGNASPSHPLDVTGIIKGSTSIYATNDLFIGDTTGSATGRLIITDSSNQGINIRRNNVVSERFKLFVGNGTTYTQDNAIILGTNTDIDFYTGSSPVKRLTIANSGTATFTENVLLAATKRLYLSGTSYIQEVAAGMIRLAPSGNDSFDITSTYLNIWVPTYFQGGPVGFGTSSPETDSGYNGITINGTSGGILFFQTNGSSVGRILSAGVSLYFDNRSTGDLVFRTTSSATERMRITSGGNVGIGTSSPSSGRLVISGDNGGTSTNTQMQINTVTSQVSISCYDPVGSAYKRFTVYSSDVRLSALGSGTVSSNADGVLSGSDGRLKNKTRLLENGLEKVLALVPTYFKWKEDSPFYTEQDYEELGFIAQEVSAVIPEASPEPETNKVKNFHDRAIIAALVKGMQEQQTMIESLQEQINELKNK